MQRDERQNNTLARAHMSRRTFVGGISATALSMFLGACGSKPEEAPAATSSNATTATASSAAGTPTANGELKLVKPGTLTVVSEIGFPPFEYMEGSKIVGFDYDVSEAIAKKLGLEVQWLNSQAFDTLIPTIKQGSKADISIAGITITDEHLNEIEFSKPYLDSNQAVVVKTGSGETLETLNAPEKKVACQSGTTGDYWITENLPKATRVPLPDVTSSELGVQAGTYNGFVIDLPVALNDIAHSFVNLEIAAEIPTGEQYGIAISKDNPALVDAINKALDEMVADGTMIQIEEKWFGSTV